MDGDGECTRRFSFVTIFPSGHIYVQIIITDAGSVGRPVLPTTMEKGSVTQPFLHEESLLATPRSGVRSFPCQGRGLHTRSDLYVVSWIGLELHHSLYPYNCQNMLAYMVRSARADSSDVNIG